MAQRWRDLARAHQFVADRLAAGGALRDGVDPFRVCRLSCGLAAVDQRA